MINMEYSVSDFDVERLREDLIDYFGTAMSVIPIIGAYLLYVSKCTDEELIIFTHDYMKEFNLRNYLWKVKRYE